MQIEEPIKSNQKQLNLAQASICIGIDLGTTNSVATYVHDGKVESIEDNGFDIIPSCVSFKQSGTIEIGKTAYQNISNPDFITISSVKRYMGSNKTLDIFGKEYTPVQISALILGKIKELAQAQLKANVDSCVITVPAHFDDNQRNETKLAAKMAGLNVKRVINEPTAAALAYGLDHKSEGVYLVYDLGGGTFDVSILKMQTGVFRVVATGGDNNIGGDDIDCKIIDYINIKYPSAQINSHQARKIKEELSIADIYHEKIENVDITLTKEEIGGLASEIIDRTLDIMHQVIKDSKIPTHQIMGLILVGGATRMPILRQKLQETLQVPMLTDLDPDKIVAIGAGIKAAGKNSGFENVLLDVVPLSLGIETLGGIAEKIIYRNTPIPCSATQYFTTSHQGQTGIILNIIQGERELAKDCRMLGQVHLKGLQNFAPGFARIAVTFEIDADGILFVRAKEENNGSEVEIELKPVYGIDYQKMSDMLISAIENAKNDMLTRLLLESREKAKMTIYLVEKALQEDGHLLNEADIYAIEKLVSDLDNIAHAENRDEIDAKIKELETRVIPFFEQRVNLQLNHKLVGQNSQEYK